MTAPEKIESETQLDELLTRPRRELIEFMPFLNNPLVILGAGGKMGPTLCVLCRRAAEEAGIDLEVIAVSRFSKRGVQSWLEERGVRTHACDLLHRESLDALPDAGNIIYLVGFKFGTTENPSMAWAMNTLVPAYVAERYRHSRIAALSSGNVYPMVPVDSRGATETAILTPVGEYANACIGRERILDYHARTNSTPVVLIRLSYAVDLRYGVLLDIAQKVFTGKPVDVTTGHLNCIWQGDANEFILRSLPLANSPATVFNLTGPSELSVAGLAMQFGDIMGRTPRIVGTESDTALLSNPSRAFAILGKPPTSVDTMVRWVADWVMQGGSTLNLPTHFEVRDGSY